MFTPKTIRAVSILALALSLLGLVMSAVAMLREHSVFFLGVLSWAILAWASFIAFQLSRSPLDAGELKRVGLRAYFIIASFGVLLFAGALIGLLLAAVLLATLWALKWNYDGQEKNLSK